MPKISRHSYDIAVVAVRRDHTSGVSVPTLGLVTLIEGVGVKGILKNVSQWRLKPGPLNHYLLPSRH